MTGSLLLTMSSNEQTTEPNNNGNNNRNNSNDKVERTPSYEIGKNKKNLCIYYL